MKSFSESVRYIDAASTSINFHYQDLLPNQSAELADEIARYWQRRVDLNSSLHDGEILCANSILHKSRTSITFGYNKNSYSTYTYHRANKINTPGMWAMGDCTVIYDQSRNSYTLSLRGATAHDEGKYSLGSGGVLPPPAIGISDHIFLQYVRSHADQETAEELIVRGKSNSVLLGLYYDPANLKVEFLYYATAQSVDLNPSESENISLIHIPRRKLAEFAIAQEHKLETSTRKHLRHWGQYLDEVNS